LWTCSQCRTVDRHILDGDSAYAQGVFSAHAVVHSLDNGPYHAQHCSDTTGASRLVCGWHEHNRSCDERCALDSGAAVVRVFWKPATFRTVSYSRQSLSCFRRCHRPTSAVEEYWHRAPSDVEVGCDRYPCWSSSFKCCDDPSRGQGGGGGESSIPDETHGD